MELVDWTVKGKRRLMSLNGGLDRLMHLLRYATVLIVGLGWTNLGAASSTLLCKVTEDYAGGWVPKTFLLALPTSEDYSDTEIVFLKCML